MIFGNPNAAIVFLKPYLFGPDYRPKLSPFGLRFIDVLRYYEAPFMDRIIFLYGRSINPAAPPGFNDNEYFEPKELAQALLLAEKMVILRAR